MKSFLTTILFSLFTTSLFATEVVDYVNPLVGSMSKKLLSTGNTYPAVALPWGMNFWTPQTGEMEMAGRMFIRPIRFEVLSRPTNRVRG